MQRRLPQAAEIARFVGPCCGPDLAIVGAACRRSPTSGSPRSKRTPRAVFDYVEGAAESELSRDRATDAFKGLVFHPQVLRAVSSVDTTTTILGRPARLPIVFGPTGFTRMMHRAGEAAVARAAGRAGVPYVLSTLGTTSIEGLAHDAPSTNRWFQLYVSKDRGRTSDLIARAAASGYTTLVLTVDVPVAGSRHRDVYNGLTVPPTLTKRTLIGMMRKPRWLYDAPTTDPLAFESLGAADDVMTLINTVFDASVTIADLAWLRDNWTGTIVVKGVQRVDDASAIAGTGVDGIAVSNDGGRQLDRAVTPSELLPAVVDTLDSSVEVYLDGGVRSGADVAAAVALGARAAFIARPYLYALMAGGEKGVDQLAARVAQDYTRTLRLLGSGSTSGLTRDLVSLPTGNPGLQP